MRIRYEVTIEDQLTFNLHFQKNSPTLKRTRFTIMLGMTVFLLSSIGAIAMLLHRQEIFWSGLLVTAIFVGLYPRSWRRNSQRMTRRLVREGSHRNLVGQRVCEIRDTGLFTRTKYLEQTVFGRESNASRRFRGIPSSIWRPCPQQ